MRWVVVVGVVAVRVGVGVVVAVGVRVGVRVEHCCGRAASACLSTMVEHCMLVLT